MTHFKALILPLLYFVAIPHPAQAHPKPATEATRAANAACLQSLPFSDRQDFAHAERGFIATSPHLEIRNAQGQMVWELASYDFLKATQAPDTVNPSLWRQAQLNLHSGLFQVTERVYQVRGFDCSNMTLVEGDSGLIIIDPLTTTETARAALDLYYAHRPWRPVHSIVYTHSHVDHFGGVKGVVAERDVRSGQVKIYAPQGFLEEAVSENITVGNAMLHRALFMYGLLLPRDGRGQLDCGLGKVPTGHGTVSLIAPTDLIREDGLRTLDGVSFHFQLAPGTEAPAEMIFFLPQFKALCVTELATHTQHNLYTLRGAQVRDGRRWWQALDKALASFGSETEVVFAQHQWPTWGHEQVLAFLGGQRDLYKCIHDQSLRLINQGRTPTELAEEIQLPEALSQPWANRGYYGSLRHNAKGIYQYYLGWYDGNPANLDPLPPVAAAQHYVAAFGGAEAALDQARSAFARGEYRWVVELLKQVVFADPSCEPARQLQADALEQLGYQAENPTWRNVYLSGAQELRLGVQDLASLSQRSSGLQPLPARTSLDLAAALSPEMILDFLGSHLDGPRAEGKRLCLNWVIPELARCYQIQLEHSVLRYRLVTAPLPPAELTLTLPKSALLGLLGGPAALAALQGLGIAQIQGEVARLQELLELLVPTNGPFPIMTPRVQA